MKVKPFKPLGNKVKAPKIRLTKKQQLVKLIKQSFEITK
jgi:hypothetical protein